MYIAAERRILPTFPKTPAESFLSLITPFRMSQRISLELAYTGKLRILLLPESPFTLYAVITHVSQRNDSP